MIEKFLNSVHPDAGRVFRETLEETAAGAVVWLAYMLMVYWLWNGGVSEMFGLPPASMWQVMSFMAILTILRDLKGDRRVVRNARQGRAPGSPDVTRVSA